MKKRRTAIWAKRLSPPNGKHRFMLNISHDLNLLVFIFGSGSTSLKILDKQGKFSGD
jgi:hypothetical protein